MFPWWSLLLLSGLLHRGRCDTNQILEKCIYYVICEEEEGIDRAVVCVHKFSKRDQDFILQEFGRFYGTLKDARHFGEIGCAGTFELGKEAVYYYYDAVFKRDMTEFHPLEDKKKMVEGRECLFEMINACKEKHEMGLI